MFRRASRVWLCAAGTTTAAAAQDFGPVATCRTAIERCRASIQNWSGDLDAEETMEVLEYARRECHKLPNVVYMPPEAASLTHVFGDVHGQGADFLNLFKLFGEPAADRPFLFNGDLVDRGPFGAEIALMLAALMVERPGAVWVNRGNHETPEMYFRYGFTKELTHKFGKFAPDVEASYRHFFGSLPVAHIVDKRIFVTHGGVPKLRDITVSQINLLHRYEDRPQGALDQMLWSDPIPDGAGRGASFTKSDTERFLKAVKCEFLLRSHEVKDEGFQMHHDGLCATVFSAPKYCGQMTNKGAVAVVRHGALGEKPLFTQFEGVDHPPPN